MTEVTEDDVKRIRELHELGMGRNTIAMQLDLNASAVKSVLEGRRKNVSDKLSVRERRELLNTGFRPVTS